MAIYVPSSQNIFRSLAALGQGLASILDPHAERREEVTQFLMENPDRAAALARQQQAGTEGQEAGAEIMNTLVGAAGGLGIPGIPSDPNFRPNEPVNVLGRGFDQDQLQEALMLTGTETPEETIERRRAEEGLEIGLPEAEAEAEVGVQQARSEQAESLTRKLRTGQELGLPELEAAVGVAEAEGAILESDFRQKMLQSAQQLANNLSPGERARFVFALQNPEYLQDLQFREGLNMREKLARLRMSVTQQGNMLDFLKDKTALTIDIQERQDNIRDRLREEGLDNEEAELAVRQFNQLEQFRHFLNPGAREFTAGTDEGLIPGGAELRIEGEQLLTPETAVDMLASQIAGGELTMEELTQREAWQNLSDEQRTQVRMRSIEMRRPLTERLSSWAERKGFAGAARVGARAVQGQPLFDDPEQVQEDVFDFIGGLLGPTETHTFGDER